ncbi:MAG TPA: hypothetical protein VFA33_07970 [Bryobacteraceae bacterium]|nr:hypothetical protein [Bryobacteraceae bacterium]
MGTRWVLAALVAIAWGIAAAQPPAIFQEGVRNAAGRIPPSLPGGAIARGARFTIEGVRFAGLPGQVRIRVAGAEARVLRVEPRTVEALMPADAPLGEAAFTVSRGGETSRPFSLRVVSAAFGIYSRNGRGWGPGQIGQVDASGRRRPNSPEAAARPGQTIVLRGTGLGGMRPRILVGGQPAPVAWVKPAAGEAGIEEVAVRLPERAAEGCWVPVAALAGGYASNTVTVAIRRGGGPCIPPADWPQPLAPGRKTAGLLFLARAFLHAEFTPGVPSAAINDEGAAVFLEAEPGEDLLLPIHLAPPSGTCTAYTGLYESAGGFTSTLLGMLLENVRGRGLDAGASIALNGARAARTLPAARRTQGFYGALLGSETPGGRARPLFLDPGSYQATAPGGPGVGPFRVSLNMPRPFSWTNEDRLETIDRARGFTVEWQGLAPTAPLGILAVNVDPRTTAMAACFCVAAPGSRGFHVPPAMLANLPAAAPPAGLPLSMLFVGSLGSAQPMQARGLDQGAAETLVIRGREARFR